MLKHKKGFTLIELLVVIAIIGILSSVVLASLNTARKKARDSQRISDLRQIQLALEFFYDDQDPNSYPVQTTAGALPNLTTGGYLPVTPTEPVAGRQAYQYSSDANGTTYCVGVDLEGSNIPDNNDSECVTRLGGTIDYAVSP
jgi:general secretion pathway protein G